LKEPELESSIAMKDLQAIDGDLVELFQTASRGKGFVKCDIKGKTVKCREKGRAFEREKPDPKCVGLLGSQTKKN